MLTALSLVHLLLTGALVMLVLMHSGKGTGLSGAFGVSGSGHGSHTERNLTRLTVAISLLWAVNGVALLTL